MIRAVSLLAVLVGLYSGPILAWNPESEKNVSAVNPKKKLRVDCSHAVARQALQGSLEQFHAGATELQMVLAHFARFLRDHRGPVPSLFITPHLHEMMSRNRRLLESSGQLGMVVGTTADSGDVKDAYREYIHDMRNPLIALNSLEVVYDELKGAEGSSGFAGAELVRLREAVAGGLAGVTGSLEIANNLMSGEPMQIREKKVSVRVLFRGLYQITRTFPSNYTVTWEASPFLPSISGDEMALHRAMLNLAKNAFHAMPSGGHIHFAAALTSAESIDTTGAIISEEFDRGSSLQYVVLSVTDTGSGIPKNVLSEIFRAGFSTRKNEVGDRKGSGYGLSSAMSVAVEHGGFMTVNSEVGEGTTFRIFLPLWAVGDEAPKDDFVPESVPDNAIVIADDDRSQRMMLSMFLKASGRAVAVSSGNAVVATIERNPGKVKVVILDMLMPGNAFEHTIDEIRSLDPSIRIIAVSGFGESHQPPTPPLGFVTPPVFHNKPLSRGDILRLVGEE